MIFQSHLTIPFDSYQAKRGAYTKTREAEVMFEQIEEARAGRGSKVLSEKEISKVLT